MSTFGAQSSVTQASSFSPDPTTGPGPFQPFSLTGMPEATITEIENESSGYFISPSGLSQGQVIGAAVGGSLGAAILVLACGFFLLGYRGRRAYKTMVIGLEGADNGELGRRCDQLESDVRALREQLDGFEARRLGDMPGYQGEAVLYTDEKDGAAFKHDTDVKGGKFRPPAYAD
ncbi:hypothetical protein K438DRAFT_1984781 [Mycena galopus ATCC 62051]|nr:hypothetical protein K438DRAFT_1984781 [Mycena galopus ATCC 62051]